MTRCGDCQVEIPPEDFRTLINPEGGYGRSEVVVCDPCMRSGRWEHWISEHWPEWPDGQKYYK